ncbi:hypothetical protein [Thioclava sp. SK-1]|uniref:hypothetical protein n=1 Tax=Thioclava sp. SK-1 TaxID=1889770 RepID=UPI00210171F2|nr:hypothetical protein [Thioclava sp. SK-1]
MAGISLAFLMLTRTNVLSPGYVFALMALFGTTRAFYHPVRKSLAPNIVAPQHLPGALALHGAACKV